MPGDIDMVTFRVNRQCLLVGVGLFGSFSKCKVTVRVAEGAEGASCSGHALAEVMATLQNTGSCLQIEDLPTSVLLRAGQQYTLYETLVDGHALGTKVWRGGAVLPLPAFISHRRYSGVPRHC
jgi:hypothetical protein